MTSSLVGSEMCIRDRCTDQHVGHGKEFPATSVKGDSGLRKYLSTPGSMPVSYTHLTLPTICSV
eukprot:7007407-Prorocentrum_lima.AAC.1